MAVVAPSPTPVSVLTLCNTLLVGSLMVQRLSLPQAVLGVDSAG